MSDWQLFGTDGCHLCEEAFVEVEQAGLMFVTLDIIDRDEWQQRYALRIPVLRHVASGAELNWPFDAEQIKVFIATEQLI